MSVRIIHGDCLVELRALAEAGERFHAVVCDPPYHLTSIVKRFGDARAERENYAVNKSNSAYMSRGFMGQKWDGGDIAFQPETWRAVYDCLLPGAHLLAFGGTRTFHRMVCAIEDAGFEIRDTVAWIYGSGFPKSLDVSKSIDAADRKRWLDIAKSIDNIDQSGIISAWIGHSEAARPAGTQSPKSRTEIGTSMPKSGFVAVPVRLDLNHSGSNAYAIIAELNPSEVHLTTEEYEVSARSSVENSTMGWNALAIFAEPSLASPEATSCKDSTAHSDALPLQSEWTSLMDKAVEALMIWLGSPQSSKQAAIGALCVELTDALKHITLSQSETFRNLDTASQTDCVSATTVTITASTAASLTSFMVATARRKAIDKAAGAERQVIDRVRVKGGGTEHINRSNAAVHDYRPDGYQKGENVLDVTAPATPEAVQWQGWGTALKPAFEPIVVARKPPDGTVAANVLKHGCGALNIDASRVATDDGMQDREGEPTQTARYDAAGSTNFAAMPGSRRGRPLRVAHNNPSNGIFSDGLNGSHAPGETTLGRWPANVVLSYPEDEYILKPDVTDEQRRELFRWLHENS